MIPRRLIFISDILGVKNDDDGDVGRGGDDDGDNEDSYVVVDDDDYVITSNKIIIKLILNKTPCYTLSSPIMLCKNYSSEINH